MTYAYASSSSFRCAASFAFGDSCFCITGNARSTLACKKRAVISEDGDRYDYRGSSGRRRSRIGGSGMASSIMVSFR